jgi:hypothetical protein
MEQLGSHWTNVHEIRFFFFCKSRKSKFHNNPTKRTGTLHEDQWLNYSVQL